jgi:hypothetical protein
MTCPFCNGTKWLPRTPDLQDRSDQEPCFYCKPAPTFEELADTYDQLRARGYSNDEAAAYVDKAMEEAV